MRCTGTKTATQETCGSIVFRCKNCNAEGCNPAADNICSNQAFRAARCKTCGKLGTHRMVKDGDGAASTH